MNVAAHQKAKGNKNTSKKKAREETGDRFRETECCLSVVVQRAAWRKNDLIWGVLGVAGTLGNSNSQFDSLQMGSVIALQRGGRLLWSLSHNCSRNHYEEIFSFWRSAVSKRRFLKFLSFI